MILRVRVTPRANVSEISGTADGILLVRLRATPTDGKANAELIRLIAELTGIPRSQVTLKSGLKSRTKTLELQGGEALIEKLLASVRPKHREKTPG